MRLKRRPALLQVITSLGGGALSSIPGQLTILASTTRQQRPGAPQTLSLAVPYIPVYFTGTGDLFAALTLGWLHHHPDDLGLALKKAVGGLQAVLKQTLAAAGQSVEGMSSRHDEKRSPEVQPFAPGIPSLAFFRSSFALLSFLLAPLCRLP